MDSPIPSFPPPALIAKAIELGFGSGPWTRAELATRWGDSTANKFIADAKEAGWLVSPLINAFYVPPARDLVMVNWLTGLARREFIISRMMAAAGFRSWCLSAWARGVGIETSDALFVTDLASSPTETKPPPSTRPPPTKELVSRNRSIAERIRTLPFLDNVILAPFLPQSRRAGEVVSLTLPMGAPKKMADQDWIAGPRSAAPGSAPPSLTVAPANLDPRRISYPLTPAVDDVAWVLAFVATLGLPRFNEALPALRKKEAQREPIRLRAFRPPFAERVRTWAGLFSPPEPNSNWRSVFQSGRTQYLLVPSSLWDQFASLSNARRFQELRPGETPA